MGDIAEYYLRLAEERATRFPGSSDDKYTFIPLDRIKVERHSEKAYLITITTGAKFDTFWAPKTLCKLSSTGKVNYILTTFLTSKLTGEDPRDDFK